MLNIKPNPFNTKSFSVSVSTQLVTHLHLLKSLSSFLLRTLQMVVSFTNGPLPWFFLKMPYYTSTVYTYSFTFLFCWHSLSLLYSFSYYSPHFTIVALAAVFPLPLLSFPFKHYRRVKETQGTFCQSHLTIMPSEKQVTKLWRKPVGEAGQEGNMWTPAATATVSTYGSSIGSRIGVTSACEVFSQMRELG